jgi:hypothetical protein
MRTADIILEQLGGHKFIVMTGSKDFISDGDTLRMTLTRNKSKANRLYITLDPDDTYTMRFFRYTSPRLKIDHKKGICEMTEEKVTEIKTYKMIYCDQLQELFTETTGLYTRL